MERRNRSSITPGLAYEASSSLATSPKPPDPPAPPDPDPTQTLQVLSWIAFRAIENIPDSEAQNELREALAHHFEAVGSVKRLQLALQAGVAAGLASELTVRIAACCELLHNASLIHDDLQDGQSLRRGQDAVWHRFGDGLAICSGDYLLSMSYGLLAETGENAHRLIGATHRAVARLIVGQSADLACCTGQKLTEDNYQAIAIGKSSDLLALPITLCLIASDQEGHIHTARDAAAALAFGYQIMDDLQDQKEDRHNNSANLINLLENQGHPSPRQRAFSLATAALDRAALISTKLPGQLGAGLVELAQDLRTRLGQDSHVEAVA